MRLMCRVLIVLLLFTGASARAQLSDGERSAALIGNHYEVQANITYLEVNNYQSKLDVYRPHLVKTPVPVVMMIHGGGWVAGSKEGSTLYVLPYLEMGFAVVNVEYRMAKVSLAPAAVEDCLCALHWIGRNAKKYNFDLNKVIVTGGSAGGHLALTTAMIPESAGFENICASEDDPNWSGPWTSTRPKVAAVVNWFGITDVADMLQGPNIRGYAVSWLGGQPNRAELAKRLSPLNYVRADLPPILTIHGDADALVPYSHAVRLHDALNKARVRNQLFTVPRGGHGDFSDEQQAKAFEVIRNFLAGAGITSMGK